MRIGRTTIRLVPGTLEDSIIAAEKRAVAGAVWRVLEMVVLVLILVRVW